MFFFTAKLSRLLLVSALLILSVLILFFMRRSFPASTPDPVDYSQNQARLDWLSAQGWEVEAEPLETLTLPLPDPPTEELLAYNALQQRQGFDLTPYWGQELLRYTYAVRVSPDNAPCQINLYLCAESIVAADLLRLGADGFLDIL